MPPRAGSTSRSRGRAIRQARQDRACSPRCCSTPSRRDPHRLPSRASRIRRKERPFTFVELLVVCTILLILASAVMPLAHVTVQRQREAELRRSLREMRTAIDKFKDAADAGQIAAQDLKAGAENYPADLETLVQG